MFKFLFVALFYLGTGETEVAAVDGSSSGHSLKLMVDRVEAGEQASAASALDSTGETTSDACEVNEGGGEEEFRGNEETPGNAECEGASAEVPVSLVSGATSTLNELMNRRMSGIY